VGLKRDECEENAGVNCSCGFDFALHVINDGKLESYAVIADARYQEFLRREINVLAAPRKSEKARARIYQSSQLIGSLQRCPECRRFVLRLPEQEEKIILAKEP